MRLCLKLDQAEQSRLLKELPRAEGAAFNSRKHEHDDYCLADTRRQIIDTIRDWGTSSASSPIFWLRGMAGTGRTTISRTVASIFEKESLLGGSFLFSRGGGDCAHAGRLVTTLALDLARHDAEYKMWLCKAVMENDEIVQRSLDEQFRHLIFGPLSKAHAKPPTGKVVIMVIDALDECSNEHDTEKILAVLSRIRIQCKVAGLKFLITSRPEIPIRLGFAEMASNVHQDFDLHDIEEYVVKEDLTRFLQHRLGKVRRKHCLPEDWPGQDAIDRLAGQAGTLFIYAATGCRFINESRSPRKAVERLLTPREGPDASHPTRALDDIYYRVLKYSYIDEYSVFRQVVGTIILLKEQLTVVELAALLSIERAVVWECLHSLYSVIHVRMSDEKIQLLHPSFRDYLLDSSRCTHANFQIHEGAGSEYIAVSCINLLMGNLKPDMCNLRHPGTLAQSLDNQKVLEYITGDISYACRHWSDHLLKASTIAHLVEPTVSFLSHHYLFWLESLSLMNAIPSAVSMLQQLRKNNAVC